MVNLIKQVLPYIFDYVNGYDNIFFNGKSNITIHDVALCYLVQFLIMLFVSVLVTWQDLETVGRQAMTIYKIV